MYGGGRKGDEECTTYDQQKPCTYNIPVLEHLNPCGYDIRTYCSDLCGRDDDQVRRRVAAESGWEEVFNQCSTCCRERPCVTTELDDNIMDSGYGIGLLGEGVERTVVRGENRMTVGAGTFSEEGRARAVWRATCPLEARRARQSTQTNLSFNYPACGECLDEKW